MTIHSPIDNPCRVDKKFAVSKFFESPRDFCFRVCYALLIPAQRVDHGRNTRGPREEYSWNTRFKQTVINDVFNKRFKRFNFVMEHESNI
jgi:hypothetical protein